MDLINQNDAIESTGLSLKTLERFSHSGLIYSETFDGVIKFSRTDIEKIFGIDFGKKFNSSESTSSGQRQALTKGDRNASLSAQIKVGSPGETQNHSSEDATIIESLRTALKLLERLIDEKDSQLNEKTDEIKWLRRRIEKLEEQAEKDKILMLTNNQTLNQLIESRNKKTIFRKLLSW